jgi:hypothetical protein
VETGFPKDHAQLKSQRALPALSCPSPVTAPHASAVVPRGMMPKAAPARVANPRGSTAPRPTLRIAYGGLAVMSILADCCAGSTRSRVTDRSDAYATVAALLGNRPGARKLQKGEAYGQLVPISLRIIDVSQVNIESLIALRKREETGAGHSLRDLRHNYIKGLEGYIKQLADVNITLADSKEIQRQFRTDMERNVREFKTELGRARIAALSSKEFIVTVLAGVATAASWFSGLQIPLENVFTWGGAPVAIGGVIATRSKYLKEREAAIKKHPMAYLYAVKHMERKRRQKTGDGDR